MKLYLGIDGGGSKTHVCAIDSYGKIVYEAFGGPSAIDTVSIEESIKEVCRTLSNLPKDAKIVSVFAGLGGVSGRDHEVDLSKRFRSSLIQLEKDAIITVKNDVSLALLSKDGTMEGMSLVLGTGSVAFGVHLGVEARVGGIHFIEGDPGSAYDLGWKAIRHIARVMDGRRQSSLFSDEIMTSTRIDSFQSLASYYTSWNRSNVALLAKIVTKHANSSKEAEEMLLSSSKDVGEMVSTLYHKLGFTNTEIVLIGGLIVANTEYRKMILNEISKVSSNILVVEPKFTPGHAAAIHAKTIYDKFIDLH